MSISRTAMLVVAGIFVLATVGCEKQSSDDEPEAEVESTKEKTAEKMAKKKSPAQPGQTGGEGKSEGEAGESSESESPTSLDELPDDVNAVQNEMQLLNTAMQNTLTLIANDTLEGIPGQLKKVHPARQLTAKAIEKGRYEPPVNADEMDEFKKLDNEFHKDLKGLLRAVENDDLEQATTQYGKLVDGCTECHTKFRFE